MIVTVTLNPAIDYRIRPERLEIGKTCRSTWEELRIGGKGINVSLILAELGFPSVATGFLAGFTGDWIAQNLQSEPLTPDFIRLPAGVTRINVKIKGKNETEINAAGPMISEKETALFLEKLDHLQNGDTLVLAGNIPPGVPQNIYEQILEKTEKKEILVAVDATKHLLRNALRYQPFLIKPNWQELCELFDTEIKPDELESYAKRLQEEGAQNVLISLGAQGSFLLDQDGCTHTCPALTGQVKDTVGAGDSMVAGFLAGYEQTHDFAHAFLLANACGAATAFSPWLAKKSKIEECLAALTEP